MYNPFNKIPKFESYLTHGLMTETIQISGRGIKMGSIWVDKKIDLNDLTAVLRKLNHYYGMILALRKGLTGKNPVVQANSAFNRYASSIMPGYVIRFSTTALCHADMTPAKKRSKNAILVNDIPRYGIIFTKPKNNHDINICHFFKTTKESNDMSDVITRCLDRVRKESNRCKSLFMQYKVHKKNGLYNINSIYGSYILNLQELQTLLVEYEKLGFKLKFDIEYFTECLITMVYNTFDFYLKRRWVEYVIEKKRKGGKHGQKGKAKSRH